jgi:hypothetical protein
MVLKNQPYDFVINTMVSFHVGEGGWEVSQIQAETSERNLKHFLKMFTISLII